MVVEGMSLVSRSLRISSQMLESSDSIWVKKRRRNGLRYGLRRRSGESGVKMRCRSGLQSGSSGLRSGFCVCVCVCVSGESGFCVCAIWVAICRSGEFEFLDLL